MISKKLSKNIALALFLINVTFFAAILIIPYCETFNFLGFLAKERLVNHPPLIFILTPALFLFSAYLCRRFEPNIAAGNLHNLDQALASLKKDQKNFEEIKKNFGFRTILINYISSLVSTFGGGALGREGPSVQMGSALFVAFADKFKKFLPNISFESWIFVGGGAGLAFTFNAPISGSLYVVEKLLQKDSIKILKSSKKLIVTMIMALISAIILRKFEAMFKVIPFDFSLNFKEIYFIILISVISAFVIYLLRISIVFFFQKISGNQSRYWFLIPLFCGLLVALISYFCGIYSFSGGILTVHEALTNSHAILSYKDFFGRFFNTIISAISGSAGGIVAPSIAIGTNLGSIISGFALDINNKILMISGIAACLGVILKRPVTAAILTLEITAQAFSDLPFLLVSSTIAYFIVQLVEFKIKVPQFHNFVKQD